MRAALCFFFVTALFACAYPQNGNPVFHQDVNWSPNGKFLSYSEMRLVKEGGKQKMYADTFIVKADGTGRRKITDDSANQYFSSWSRDGSRIVYGSADRSGKRADIVIAETNGGKSRTLVSDGSRNSAPVFSPVGDLIAFASNKGSIKFQIYLLDLKTNKTKRVTSDDAVAFYNPQFSPDGKRIVFYAEKGDSKDQIWTMNIDGSDARLLTGNKGHNIFPAYMPGGRIVFSTNLDGEHKGVFTMKPDGSDKKQMKQVRSSWIRFSPDGKRIAFVSGRFPKTSIFVANADGSEPMKIAG